MGLGLRILRRTVSVRGRVAVERYVGILVHHGSTEDTEKFKEVKKLRDLRASVVKTSYVFARSTSSTVLMSTIPKQP
jgi:hypothetical protein